MQLLLRPARVALCFVAGLLLVVLCACTSSETSRCAVDADCPAGFRCDVTLQQCVCASDEGCGPGSFCNRAGVCQRESGCQRNSDCPDDAFCDISSGNCLAGQPFIEEASCGLSSQCGPGLVCVDGLCVPGCFDAGDCPIGEVCREGSCVGGFGVCDISPDCEFGQVCDQIDEICRNDVRGPYCRACTRRSAANPEPCDDPRNYCLVNNRELGGFTNFCGVDCSLGQPCPSGYGCSGVVILTEARCFNSAECQCSGSVTPAVASCNQPCDPRLPDGSPDLNAPPCVFEGQPECNGGAAGGEASCIVQPRATSGICTCATDDDCRDGETCAAGLCCSGSVRTDRECRGGEGTTSGFCSCATDDDCPRNNCNGLRGVCELTGLPCVPGNNDCDPVPCINGGCLIGQNCAPAEGLACSDVRRRP